MAPAPPTTAGTKLASNDSQLSEQDGCVGLDLVVLGYPPPPGNNILAESSGLAQDTGVEAMIRIIGSVFSVIVSLVTGKDMWLR